MSVSLKCSISLSKKIRAIIGDAKAHVVLNVDNVVNGIGNGTLMISTDGETSIPQDFLTKETSIMITPMEIEDEIQNVHSPVLSIFNENDKTIRSDNARSPIDRLAVRFPPEKGNVSTAMKTEEEINEDVKANPTLKEYISNLSELLEAINISRAKSADIDLDAITDIRQKAIAMEQKEMMESIDQDAWVVTTKYASMTINDLGIQLSKDTPYNLNRLSAKKLFASKDLKNYIAKGEILLISPEEAVEYAALQAAPIQSGLDVYDSFDDAKDDVFSNRRNANEREDISGKQSTKILSLDDLSSDTEEEKMIQLTNVGKPLPGKGTTLSGGVKKTTHSAGNAQLGVTRSNNVNANGVSSTGKMGSFRSISSK